MKIEIEIPKEFEKDYKGDTFKDFFSRVLCDIDNKGMCGNYEKEIAEMFIKAFDESKQAYNIDKVVEELEGQECEYQKYNYPEDDYEDGFERGCEYAYEKAVKIVKRGGVNE